MRFVIRSRYRIASERFTGSGTAIRMARRAPHMNPTCNIAKQQSNQCQVNDEDAKRRQGSVSNVKKRKKADCNATNQACINGPTKDQEIVLARLRLVNRKGSLHWPNQIAPAKSVRRPRWQPEDFAVARGDFAVVPGDFETMKFISF